VNLAQHVTPDGVDHVKLQKTIRTAMRMLDNVIDLNLYNVKKARNSNLRHRPVGLGLMGYQSALYTLRLPFDSKEAIEFADRSMEAVCYYAYMASTHLAEERGRYMSFKGSLWDQGILPLDSIAILEKHRGQELKVDKTATLDWDTLRERIRVHGMRNSNCVAIAPTATIANIIGVEPAIEPIYLNLSVKSNQGGEFTVLNHSLVQDLKKLGLWDKQMVADLKHYDGSLQQIERVPEELRALYKTSFEVNPMSIIEGGARRQKWIDQAQSLNVFLRGATGKLLSDVYTTAWEMGLKTTYYLRTMGATHAEKSTIHTGSLNAVRAGGSALDRIAEQARATLASAPATDVKVCSMEPGCESCQ
jgi:ribonucleoside-diphosphate reductase alpha chain